MRTLLVGIIMLSTFWLLILLGGSLMRTSGNGNLNYIPSDANSIVILHGHELLRHTIEDVILKTHDNELVGIILEQLGERKEEGDEIIKTGINFNSDVVYYAFIENKTEYNACLFNLSSESNFVENMPKAYPSVGIATDGNVGLIVQEVGVANQENTKKLYSIATKKLKINPKGFKEEEENNGDGKIIACIHIPQLERNTDIELDINVKLEDQTINFFGDSDWDATKHEHWAYRSIPPVGLHVSSSIIPDFLEDTLRGMLMDAMPEIISFSANFVGTEMVEIPIFRIVPDLDILVEFGAPFALDSSLAIAKEEKDISSLTANSFKYGGKLFYYKQIDPLTIYVGRRKPPKLEKVSAELLLNSNGDLSTLTKVGGSGIVYRLVKFLSIYNAGKDFLNSTDEFEFEIREIEKGKASVKGSIHFIDGKRPTNEVIKLLLRGDLDDLDDLL